jgi:hypothetical protein
MTGACSEISPVDAQLVITDTKAIMRMASGIDASELEKRERRNIFFNSECVFTNVNE